MQIILKKNHAKLGSINDVVKVKDGYARNYLIPQDIAIPATKGNVKQIADLMKSAAKRDAIKLAGAEDIAAKIRELSCTIRAKVKDNEEIYGSVTATDIFNFLKKEGFAVDKSSIIIPEPIKKLGAYDIVIKLHRNVDTQIKVWVVAEDAQ